MINKSATIIGRVLFQNGNITQFGIGGNSNTGETIVWQRTLRKNCQIWGRWSRVTGRNIATLAEELDFVLNEGEASWIDPPNVATLNALAAFRRPS